MVWLLSVLSIQMYMMRFDNFCIKYVNYSDFHTEYIWNSSLLQPMIQLNPSMHDRLG